MDKTGLGDKKLGDKELGVQELGDHELLRYSRQIMLPKFDVAGQLALVNSRMLIIGLGGLGSPVSMYLAAAGVGHLELADYDEVDLSNLQRQIVHQVDDIGRKKVESAAESLRNINPDIQLTLHSSALSGDELSAVIADVDVVIDCTDNFATRFEINACCVAHGIPLVSGAAIRMEGQISVFDMTDDSPCYQCLYPDLSDEELTCSESGVMAPLVGVIGSMQALEAIKLVSQVGKTLAGRVLLFDASYMEWRSVKLKKDPACKCCSK